LKDLTEKGIEIVVNDVTHQVYFITSLILGDNLGLNSICGFTSSFKNSHFCRVCYVGSDKVHCLCSENPLILRTVHQYERDILNLKITSRTTGLKEKCIFNKLDFFHIIKNYNFDVMHDLFEGVCSSALALILLQFIEVDKFLTVDYVSYQMNSLDFSLESGSLPNRINLEYLKKK